MSGLEKQTLPIAFGQGIDTKTDPKQVIPGKLTDLQNGSFQTNKEIRKRPGYSSLPSLSAGVGIQSYNDELISLDGSSLYSYNSNGASQALKGTCPNLTLSTQTVVRTTTQQTNQDSAINGTLKCFVWYDSIGHLGYSVIDTVTGQSIVNNQTLSATGTVVKVLSLGANFVVIYFDTNSVYYRAISTSTPTVLGAAVLIANDIEISGHGFDASVFNSRIYVAYGTTTANRVSMYFLSSSLALSTKLNVTTTVVPSTITVFGDSSFNAWVGYALPGLASKVYAFIANPNLTATVLAETQIDAPTGTGARNITGVVSGTTGTFYYECTQANSFQSTELTPNRLISNTMTLTGTVGTAAIFRRGVGLASKVFSYNSVNYLVVAFQSILQSGYFLLNGSAQTVLKLSPQEGGGYTAGSILPEVNTVSSGVFQTASLIKDLLTVSAGTIGTQTGVLSATFSFSLKDPSKFVLGKNLHIAGGILNMYDGASVVEHGFNVYPEGLATSLNLFATTPGGLGPGASTSQTNQYQYSAVYEWTDNQGQLHQSSPSVPVNVTIPAYTKIQFTGTAASGSADLTSISPASGYSVGMYVYLTDTNGAPPVFGGFPQGATITGISGTTITLSSTSTLVVGTHNFIATNSPADIFQLSAAPPGTTSFTFAFGSPREGQTIFGALNSIGSSVALFPVGTKITSVIGSTLTTSAASLIDSTPRIPVFTNDTYSVTLTLPTLKLTAKTNVSIALYRTAVNGTVFYRTTSPTALTYSDPTANSILYVDTVGDGDLVGNEQLYTTGGEVENISIPAVSVATTFKSRAIAVLSENPLSWWYAKQVIPGVPVEFSDLFVSNVDSRIGSITAVGVLDEKIIFFGPNTKYFTVGEGPSPSGSNNDFSSAQHITGSTGSSNQASILEVPIGLMYQDLSKGIYLLDRSLQEQYIGKDVEAYNSQVVTSAQTVPGTTSVRFTLDSGTVLNYNWFENQWSTDPLASAAVSSTLFQNKFTYITSAGSILTQSTGFTDGAAFIPLSLTTGWMSFAGVQGFERVRRLLILGNYKSAHTLNIQIYTDFNDVAPSQTVAIPVTSDPGVYQYRIHLAQQKCESIKIKIYDSQTPTYGEGFSISSMAFEVGVKRGAMKLPVGKSY